MEFPIFKTKVKGLERKFNLIDQQEQKEYFEAKAGEEIKKLRKYLKNNTFVAYLLGKKNSGKGTYSKMFAEVVAPEKIAHLSVGDMVREADEDFKDEKKKAELLLFLEKNYRGPVPLKDAISSLEQRSIRKLLPTELIMILVKKKMTELGRKALFIDGFPRGLDQISYSLFFRDLIGYRDDPDMFILIDLPDSVIDERIKWRRICPRCQTSRNIKLFLTSKVEYDKEKNEFYLRCDNHDCSEARMVLKEGDELGVEPIKERLKMDEKLMGQAFSLHGIPKILLRNALPVEKVKENVDEYEITPEYVLEWDKKEEKVKVTEKPWVILDNNKVPSNSLLAQPVLVSLIKQMVKVLNL